MAELAFLKVPAKLPTLPKGFRFPTTTKPPAKAPAAEPKPQPSPKKIGAKTAVKTKEEQKDKGVVRVDQLLAMLRKWYYGEGEGFDESVISWEGAKRAWDNLKTSFLNPANLMTTGVEACWDDLMEKVEALKLPQGPPGPRGRWTRGRRGRPKKSERVVGESVRHRAKAPRHKR